MSVRHYVGENIYRIEAGIYDHPTWTIFRDEGINQAVLDFEHIEAHWREVSEAEAGSYQVAYRVSYLPTSAPAL